MIYTFPECELNSVITLSHFLILASFTKRRPQDATGRQTISSKNTSENITSSSHIIIPSEVMSICSPDLRSDHCGLAFYPQRDGKWVPAKVRWHSAAGE